MYMYIPVPTYVRSIAIGTCVARREGSVCVRVRAWSYAYKYACDTYVVHACDTRALVKLPLGGTVHVRVLYICHVYNTDVYYTCMYMYVLFIEPQFP